MTQDAAPLERRLAAILAADVVGYSALVEQNAESTIKAVKSLWQNIIDPSARQEGGRVVKTMGDGVLAEFPSAVRAVQCALNVQEALAAGDAAFPDGIRLVLRIGLHLGDIIIDGDDIFGDGVNLAARLESLAEPGSLCISAAVMDQLAADVAAAFADNGEQTVKNISRPVKTYVLKRADAPSVPDQASKTLQDRKPTLAIGTFEALTKDDTSDVLTQGCQQTTAALLSSLTGLTLISPKNAPDYLAEARFQVLGNRFRCALTLAETQDERPVLSTRLDGEIDDLFDVQDRLSSQITTALRYAVMENEGAKAAAGSDATDEQILAYAGQLLMGPEAEAWVKADKLLDQYLARHPQSFMGLSMKACALTYDAFCGIMRIPDETAQEGLELVSRAHAANDQSDFMHLVRATYLFTVQGDLDGGLRAIDRCLQVNPDYVLGQNAKGLCLALKGDTDTALSLTSGAVKALSGNRIVHRMLSSRAFCEYAADMFEEAIATAHQSLEHAPVYPQSLAFLAASQVATGKLGDAEQTMARLLQVQPGLTAQSVRTFAFSDPQKEKLLIDRLRQAGLPES